MKSPTSKMAGKARRLLAAGRVRVLAADAGRVVAAVDGDHGAYTVAWTRAGGWRCDCRGSDVYEACSHTLAVQAACGRDLSVVGVETVAA